jgi:signal transduction histidine kinase
MAERRRDTERWERNLERGVVWVPYLLLAGATAFTLLLQPSQTWRYRLTIVGLAAVAAAWLLFMHTLRSQRWRRRPVPMTVYFAVMLLIAVLLMQRSFFFVAFACTGFIQAFAVLPTTLALIGLLATSVIVNTRPGEFPNGTLGSVLVWLFIIGLQTTLTGFFSFMGAKLMEEHIKRRELVAQLEAALAENAGLHEQLLVQAREAGVLDERQRMAREIHDTLAQGLTGIITQLEAAERAQDQPGQRQRHLDQARRLARENLTEARRSVQALRPEPLEDARLPDAVGAMARRWAEASTVQLSFQTTGEPRPLLAELEATLFRVAQEALTNVGKHARASKVGLTLSYMDDTVLLDVRDDGVGFSAGPAGNGATGDGGFGLKAMRQRLRRVAGNLEIESAPGEGTAINASVPAIPAEGGA